MVMCMYVCMYVCMYIYVCKHVSKYVSMICIVESEFNLDQFDTSPDSIQSHISNYLRQVQDAKCCGERPPSFVAARHGGSVKHPLVLVVTEMATCPKGKWKVMDNLNHR